MKLTIDGKHAGFDSRPLARLRDGTLVLGTMFMGSPKASTYANRTQAERAANLYSGVVIKRGRPWYVRIDLTADCPRHADGE